MHTHIHTAPASVACHLLGNSGLSKRIHTLTLELDYLCIFLASVRILYI